MRAIAFTLLLALSARGDVIDNLLTIPPPLRDWRAVIHRDAAAQKSPVKVVPASEVKRSHDDLLAIAADANAPAGERAKAIEALAKADWPGRDAWVISLASDPAMTCMHEGYTGYNVIGTITFDDPEHWIPIMTPLVGSADFNVRSAAVNALAAFHRDHARADALRPIIRWISDPQWARDVWGLRLRLIQSAAQAGLREAIPHLVAVVENDRSGATRSYAAEALADFGDSSGNEAMRQALGKEKLDAYDFNRIVEALVRAGGFSNERLADGVIAYVRKLDDAPKCAPTLTPFLLGEIAVHLGGDREELVQAILAGDADDKTKLRAVSHFTAPSAAQFIARNIITLDEETLRVALAKRDLLRQHAQHELWRVAARGGIAGAIAIVIAGNAHDEAALVAHGTIDEQRALLAAARATGEPIELNSVASLFGRSPALDRAAEAFLEAADTPPARAILYARHRGEAFICGMRSDAFIEWEESLRKRVVSGEYDEIIALHSYSGWVGQQRGTEIGIRGSEATLLFGKKKGFSQSAVAELLEFIRANDVDNLPPMPGDVDDGTDFEFIHITRDGGARLFMDTPELGDTRGSVYDELVKRLSAR
jgi:hypothetical protein